MGFGMVSSSCSTGGACHVTHVVNSMITNWMSLNFQSCNRCGATRQISCNRCGATRQISCNRCGATRQISCNRCGATRQISCNVVELLDR